MSLRVVDSVRRATWPADGGAAALTASCRQPTTD